MYGARDEVDKQLEIYQAPGAGAAADAHARRSEGPEDQAAPARVRAAAAQLPRPIELDIREASSAQDLRRIFRSLRPGEVDGAFLLSPSLRLNHTALTIRLAKRRGSRSRRTARNGSSRGRSSRTGSISRLIGRTGARYVDSILRGTSPADLPVEEVPKLEFAINLETAGRLGIKVPQDMIIRADEVYR